MRLAPVFHLVGVILRVFGLTLLAPALVSLIYGERHDLIGFLLTGAIAVVTGHLMRAAADEPTTLRRTDALAVVAGTWMVVAMVAAIPYLWVGHRPVDAMFESMSGLTTTGATIFEDFGRYGRGLFFWRALTQWLGGMGVIALFVAVLPRLAIAGRQLFFAEAPGPTDEKLTPQIRKTAAVLWRLYTALTLAQVVALMVAGFPLYEAVTHAFTTLAAGGFSPHPLSVMGYANPAAEWVIIVFMFLAGANFAVQYRALSGGVRELARDEEVRAYAGIIVAATALLVIFLSRAGDGLLDAVRLGLFQCLTILTTTGYASADFQLWSDEARIVLLALMFVGGSAGSAAGGPKVVRFVLLARYALAELRRTLHPRAVLPVKLGGRVVPEEVMRSVLVFFLLYLLVFAVCALIVTSLEGDILTGVTASIATLGNIGPGLNGVGPMASYAPFGDVTKVVLTLAMWMGRLELMAVLVLLRPEVWRTASWSDVSPDHSRRRGTTAA
jgi:trk system potassium uptake protein